MDPPALMSPAPFFMCEWGLVVAPTFDWSWRSLTMQGFSA